MFHEILHTAVSLIQKVKFQNCCALDLSRWHSPCSCGKKSSAELPGGSSWFVAKPQSCSDGKERCVSHLHLYLHFPEHECYLSQPLPGPDSSLPFTSHAVAGSWASLQTPLLAARGHAGSWAALHLGGPSAMAGLWFPISLVGKGPINSGAVKVIGFHVQRLNLPCPPLGLVGNL